MRIEKLGFTQQVKHEENYKVFVGTYKSRESAEKALKRVRKEINPGAFIVTR